MAIIHDHYDMLLVSKATSSASGSAEVEGDRIIDIEETGGLEGSQLVLTCPAANQALTLEVLGCDTEDGEFETVLEFKTTASTEFSYRERTPLNCPRYIKLKVTNGATAPTAPVEAVLRFAC